MALFNAVNKGGRTMESLITVITGILCVPALLLLALIGIFTADGLLCEYSKK